MSRIIIGINRPESNKQGHDIHDSFDVCNPRATYSSDDKNMNKNRSQKKMLVCPTKVNKSGRFLPNCRIRKIPNTAKIR